ncbi:MAG: hypothetical protein ABWX92_03625 [Mycetocola sp.]
MFTTDSPTRAALASPAVLVLALTAAALVAAVYTALTTGDITPVLEAGRRLP